MSGLGYVSVPVIKQYLQYASQCDIDIESALRQSYITTDILEQENERITGEQLQALLTLLVEQADDRLFGLKSGELVQTGSYSVLGYITMTCGVFSEVIDCIQPYEKLVGDMGVTSIGERGDDLHISWHCAYPSALVKPHMVDNVFASWVTYARWLAGEYKLNPTCIMLQRPKPNEQECTYYEGFYGCPVLFDQIYNTIVLPKAYLSMTLRQPDHNLRKTLEQHALSQMLTLEAPQTLSLRVKEVIHILLAKGITRKDMVASHLNMSEKTLQRKLQLESTSYQKLLDEARLVLATEYLLHSEMSFEDIAIHLGFAEVRSFFRSFKLWTGTTPNEFREHAAN